MNTKERIQQWAGDVWDEARWFIEDNGEQILGIIAIVILICTLFSVLVSKAHAQVISPAHSVTRIAYLEIGNGEIGGNNKGCYVRKYCLGKEVPWCAGFVSWVLNKAEITSFPYCLCAKSFYNLAKAKGMIVKKPKTGDLIVFNRNGGGHVGIVYTVNKNGVTTIEGNVGKYPSKVKKIINSYDDLYKRGFIAYIRLQKGVNNG